MNPVFDGKVEQGKLTLTLRERFDEYLLGLQGPVEVIVRRLQKKRSKNQNAYYRGVVIKIFANHLGYFPDEMHEICRQKFLLIEDGRFQYVRSTKSLSTSEMEDYLAKIRMWAASEYSCYIPEPNEIDYIWN